MEAQTMPITKLPQTNRKMSTTSQMFHRIDNKLPTSRQLKSSKDPRSVRHQIKKLSLDNSKQNITHQRYLQNVKSALKINENQIASNYLLSLRKQYDKMAKTIKQKSTGINLLKKQIQYMRNKLRIQSQSSLNVKQRLQKSQNQLIKIHQKQQQANMETKILGQIIFRMKQQQIKNKNISSSIQTVMKQKKLRLKIIQDQILQWDETIHRAYQHMTKIQQKFNKTKQDRKMKFNDFKNYVVDIQDQQKFQSQRRQRTYQLLSMQSNDIMDAKNIVLREVLMTNKVLDKLLQSKINDLLNQYQGLQNSYHLIKTQTNISDPQALATKFFSYSQNLQEIASKINVYEERQQSLLQHNQKLKQYQKNIIIKRLEQEKSMSDGSDSAQQQKQKLMQECLEKQLVLKKIRTWLDKINSFLGPKRIHNINISDQVIEVCNLLTKQVEQLKKDNSHSFKFQNPGVRLKKLIKQFSDEQIKQRRSEAQEIKQSNHAENMYIYQQRKKVKNMFLIKVHATPKVVQK